MSNVMSMARLKNHTSRSGFDLSRKNAFTAKVGELLPVMVEECLPGDKFKIKPSWFTRTMPVNTAAYTRIKEYYDFYFVPNRLLWRFFPQFVTQMDQTQSATSATADSKKSFTKSPYITQRAIYQTLGYMVDNNLKDIFGRTMFESSQKLLNYLDYGFYRYQNTIPNPNLELNPFPLLAYQKIYYDWYRNSQWEDMSPACWNIDFCTDGQDLRDVYGAGNANYFRIFELRYANWHKDLFMGVLPRPQYGDEVFSPIDVTLNNTLAVTTSVDKTVNYETQPNGVGSGASVTWKQNGGRAGYLLAGDTTVGEDYIRHGHNATSELTGSLSASNSGLSILALRQAQALQKWKEISLAHNKDYKNQVKAHFGVNVSDILSNRCSFIGGTSNVVEIGEVVNNNLTGDNSASIGGKGVGNGYGKIEYDVKEHGIMMCIYHAEPLLDYQSNGVSRFNTKIAPTDYAIPELDRIGMERVPSLYLADVGFYPTGGVEKFLSGTVGYAPRYWDYKTKVDQLHGAFTNGNPFGEDPSSLYQWVAPRSQADLCSFFDDFNLSNYVFFKINPSVLNPIFVQQANSSMRTDHLLCNCQFNVDAVRNLDYDGLPY